MVGDIAVVSVAVNCLAGQGGWEWRVAVGAAGPTPLRAPKAEAALAEDTTTEGVARAAELASAAARPIDDIRASAAYRKAMVRVLARRGIESVLAALTLSSVPPRPGVLPTDGGPA
jgi:carbon-monoxide dehydrogenase medium subunit